VGHVARKIKKINWSFSLKPKGANAFSKLINDRIILKWILTEKKRT
jgi:hypothetical protein